AEAVVATLRAGRSVIVSTGGRERLHLDLRAALHDDRVRTRRARGTRCWRKHEISDLGQVLRWALALRTAGAPRRHPGPPSRLPCPTRRTVDGRSGEDLLMAIA